MKPKVFWHALVLILANCLDLLSTMVGLKAGGQEANPLVRFILDSHGIPGLVVFKFGGTVLLLLLAWRKPSWLLAAATAFLAVSCNNLIATYVLLGR